MNNVNNNLPVNFSSSLSADAPSDQLCLPRVGVALLDLDGNWVTINQDFYAIFGYRRDELLSLTLRSFIGPDSDDEYAASIARVLRQEIDEYAVEKHCERRDGSLVWIKLNVSLMRNNHGQPLSFVVVVEDITGRKDVEAERKHLLQERVALLESAGEGIYGVDLDGVCTFINKVGASLLGYDEPAALIGQTMHTMVHHHYANGQLYPIESCPILLNMVERRGVSVDTEVWWRRDGSPFPVEYRSYPIHEDEVIRGAVVTFGDISVRKELEHRKDVFISMAGHELRTPMTSMKGNLQLAERRLLRLLSSDEKLSPEVDKQINDVIDMVRRTLRQLGVQNRLVSDLLDVSRIQASKLDLARERINLISLVQEAVEDMRAMLPDRIITFSPSGEDVLWVLADPDRIGQVVNNYLTNALKYSPVDQPVEVSLTREEDIACVTVHDHGPGLTEGQQVNIWQQSYQVPGILVQSGTSVGLGLGLYICQMLITQHGGQVGVESRQGEGATFWFTLPVLRE